MKTFTLIIALTFIGAVLAGSFLLINVQIPYAMPGKSMNFQKNLYNRKENSKSSLAYTPTSPITINSNSGFSSAGFTGSGSLFDPYVLSGINITAAHVLIDIENTNAYFTIKNSLFVEKIGFTDSLELVNVSHGTVDSNAFWPNTWQQLYIGNSSDSSITSNIFTNNYIASDSIVLYNDFNILVSNNSVSGLSAIGISIEFSNNSIMSNNFINETTQGAINTYKNVNMTYLGNHIENNTQDGFEITKEMYSILKNNFVDSNQMNGLSIGQSQYNVITGNTISNNKGNGTYFYYQSNDNQFIKNIVSGNIQNGLVLALNSNFNFIYSNRFANNKEYNVDLDESSGNLIIWNNFLKTNLGLFQQALNNGLNNEFIYNYWSDWTSPDNNKDGFVDYPYLIIGNGYVKDDYPLASEINNLNQGMSLPINNSSSISSTVSNPTEFPIPMDIIYGVIIGVLAMGVIMIIRRKK